MKDPETPGGPGPEAVPDRVLCDAIRSGEAWPLATLWERHHGVALSWARSKDPVHAEDAVANAFDAIYRALLGGGGPSESFRSYLFRTVNTELSRVWTAEQRQTPLDDFDAPDPGHVSMEDLAVDTEERRAAAAALDDLPMRWKQVILEVDVGGRSVQEVAAELELTPNSTTVLLKRAREGLKKSWLKRMHPATGLEPNRAGCVAEFSEIRWGKRNGRRRRQAEEHLSGCPGCRSRWGRFSEQATVIGMVSAGVIAMHSDWKRKAVIVGSSAAAAVVLVGVGIAVPALMSERHEPAAPLPASPAAPDGSTGSTDSGVLGVPPGGAAGREDSGDAGAASSGDAAGRPTTPTDTGDTGDTGGGAPVPPASTDPDWGAEISNRASVNVNDLDLDLDGEPGSPTNEVWTRWGSASASKVDADDPASGLAGAKFRVLVSDEVSGCRLDDDLTVVLERDGSEYTVVSGRGGAISLPGLWVGDDDTTGTIRDHGLTTRCYVLEEIEAPDGYELPQGSAARTEIIVRSTVDPADAQTPVVIENRREPRSPLSLTGSGAGLIIAGGAALIALGVGGALVARRRSARPGEPQTGER